MRGAWAIACSAAFVGCGDALVSGDYRGEPIFKVEGQITAITPLQGALADADLSISLFWSPLKDPTAPNQELFEQKSVSTTVRFPATFQLRVFEPPGDDYFASADASWVAGLLLVYVDSDADGLFDGSEPLVGGMRGRGLLYARTALAGADSPTGVPLAAGFNVIDLPFTQVTCEQGGQMDHRGGGGGPMSFGCAADRPCREGLVCDLTDRTCRPSETLQLTIEPNFMLGRPLCMRP